MPKIYEYFGFVFFFYSNEHEPIHVHVMHGECQSIFDLIMMDGRLVALKRRNTKGYNPLSEKNSKVAEQFIHTFCHEIIQKWVDYFVLKKKVSCTEIKTRL